MRVVLGIALCLCLVLPVVAADYNVETTSDGPPDDLSSEIAKRISAQGFKVVSGTSRTLYEFWPCKQWEVDTDQKLAGDVLYPFKPGQLIGAARLPRDGDDFRDQDLEEGVYTLRYAQQPIDGAHVGTFPTRDFLLLVHASDDTSAGEMEYEELVNASATAALSSHPAMLCLLKATAPGGQPSIRHDEDQDWWIVSFQGTAADAGQTSPLPVDLVVVGMADE